MKREVIETADGSKTIYIAEMDENYHSGHGALQEAVHVFIQNGLRQFKDQAEVKVFEMGFGSGLNALLTMVEAENNFQKIHYVGIEAFPVEMELIEQIGYEKLVDEKFEESFLEMHTSSWNRIHSITNSFSFEKIHSRIEDYDVRESSTDLIYFDAFGPRAQKEMWELNVLDKMYRMLKTGGVLVTYCANGQFKRNLKSLGFIVESLPGPPGKREMTKATKFLD